MSPGIAALEPLERLALAHLLDRVLAPRMPPVVAAVLFGSKARGDFDRRSDVDLLLLCDVPPRQRLPAARACARAAGLAGRHTGVHVETWTVSTADLAEGRRTPMLVDALHDGLAVWPPGGSAPRVAFTPADACFCAGRLLAWVRHGGNLALDALQARRPAVAAVRVRDDITRMATAALLLTGDTRHRRRSSLHRFRIRFVRPGLISEDAAPAVDWALRAFPADGGRGRPPPPPAPTAVRTAGAGLRLAARMQREVVPWIHQRMDDLRTAPLAE